MERQPVRSSFLASVGWDSVTHELELEFKSGNVVCYVGVPAKVYNRLMWAESIGSCYALHIRHRFSRKRPTWTPPAAATPGAADSHSRGVLDDSPSR